MEPVPWFSKKKKVDENTAGILSYTAQTHSVDEVDYINMGISNYPHSNPRIRYLKMKGRKVYEYALKHVPDAMKACIDKSGQSIHSVKKIFIHQANEKMDEAIIKKLYQLFEIDTSSCKYHAYEYWLVGKQFGCHHTHTTGSCPQTPVS